MNKELPKLGQLIDENAKRDAVHIAICPVMFDDLKAYPGDHVGIVRIEHLTDGDRIWVSQKADKKIGIIDPFLEFPVYHNQRFWMFLYPNTVTSLRHVYTHPALDNE
jgi:hypothetical protein